MLNSRIAAVHTANPVAGHPQIMKNNSKKFVTASHDGGNNNKPEMLRDSNEKVLNTINDPKIIGKFQGKKPMTRQTQIAKESSGGWSTSTFGGAGALLRIDHQIPTNMVTRKDSLEITLSPREGGSPDDKTPQSSRGAGGTNGHRTVPNR